jgi:hypothetical protein
MATRKRTKAEREVIRAAMSMLGRARSPAKTEAARRAIRIRWDRAKKAREQNPNAVE